MRVLRVIGGNTVSSVYCDIVPFIFVHIFCLYNEQLNNINHNEKKTRLCIIL